MCDVTVGRRKQRPGLREEADSAGRETSQNTGLGALEHCEGLGGTGRKGGAPGHPEVLGVGVWDWAGERARHQVVRGKLNVCAARSIWGEILIHSRFKHFFCSFLSGTSIFSSTPVTHRLYLM